MSECSHAREGEITRFVDRERHFLCADCGRERTEPFNPTADMPVLGGYTMAELAEQDEPVRRRLREDAIREGLCPDCGSYHPGWMHDERS